MRPMELNPASDQLSLDTASHEMTSIPDQVQDDTAIAKFMTGYHVSMAWYEKLAKKTKTICKKGLAGKARAEFECRAKKPASLEKKLYDRHKDFVPQQFLNTLQDKNMDKSQIPNMYKGYRDVDDISNDIEDLAGVRIAIHYPHQNQWDTVNSMIYDSFDVLQAPSVKEMDLDYDGLVFPGYTSRHYHVRVRQEDIDIVKPSEAHRRVEIQVRSIAVHVWAMISHRIAYKPQRPSPSERLSKGELDAMRLLNSLAHSEEVVLAQLWTCEQKRLDSFKSENDLGVYLESTIPQTRDKNGPDSSDSTPKRRLDGTLDILLHFMQTVERDSAETLAPIMYDLDFRDAENHVRRAIDEEFAGYRLKPSVYIIQHLLNKYMGNRPYAFNKDSTYQNKCKVLATAFIWVEKLFTEHRQITELVKPKGAEADSLRSSLKFMHRSMARVLIMDGEEAHQEHKKNIDDLWDWFEGQTAKPLVLVFKICRHNVLENLPDEMSKVSRTTVLSLLVNTS